jgi:3-hydroxyisobutyrate dehydrogenase-like beta-hydroxyacid dehydrogenase
MIPLSIIHADSVNKGMCKNIVTRGDLENPLIIFNRTAKRAEDLSKSLPSGKSVVLTSIDEVVSKSDIIFICVSDDAAVNETIDTALKSDVKGKLFVDCSTVHPDTTEGLAKKITAAGAEFGRSPL